jgi:hypothetical protein
MKVHLEKLLQDAAECRLISDLATEKGKRDLFARLAEHLKTLADEVEREIASQRDMSSG